MPLFGNKTPFECFYNKPPPYHHLRVFRCLAYATDVHATHKFVPHAEHCFFLSYPTSQKAYKLDDLHFHKLFTSRAVVFQENKFSYKSSHFASTNNNYVLPYIVTTFLTKKFT
jgi:hypothetical protein